LILTTSPLFACVRIGIFHYQELISIKGSVVERGGRLAVRVVVREKKNMNNNAQLKGDR